MPKIVTLYLLHFPVPYRHAAHYAGVTQRETLRPRMQEHLSGEGSALVRAAAMMLGISDPDELIERALATTWQGTRDDERRIKNFKNLAKVCPICRAVKGLRPWQGLQREGVRSA